MQDPLERLLSRFLQVMARALQPGLSLLDFGLQSMLEVLALADDIATGFSSTVDLRDGVFDFLVHAHVGEDVVEDDVGEDAAAGDVEMAECGYFGRDLCDLVLQHADLGHGAFGALEIVELLHAGHGAPAEHVELAHAVGVLEGCAGRGELQ